ncbi:MAG: hypothetical protein J6U54_22885 [Clostridiales bacterium]|nr:hypothetical protein [Clostridiales bacterium]
MPYGKRPPYVVQPRTPDPEDEEALAREAERRNDIAQLEALLNAVIESRDTYDNDVSTFNSSLSFIDDSSPIIVNATERISDALAAMPYDEYYGNMIKNINNAITYA